MKRLTRWYNKRDLTEDQLDTWDHQIGRIPQAILPQLVDQIIDSNKFMPTPGEIKKLFGEFKQYNPDQFILSEQEKEFCSACNGEGRILAWKVTEAFPYEYDLACGLCNNWRRVFPTRPSGFPAYIVPPKRMTTEQILKAGFVLESPWSTEKTAEKEYKDINEMAEAVGSTVQDEIPF